MSDGRGLESRLAAATSVATAREALAAEEAVWIVGGAVRDALLSESVGDADLAVAPGRERDAARAIARAAGGAAFPLSERHATWRVVVGQGKGGGGEWHVDVTALRADTINDDLRARDFTVNAVAVPLRGGEPIDPTGGLADAEALRLRVVSEAAFTQDPLRLMRAARIAAGHSLEIEEGTLRLARSQAELAAEAAGERQFA